MARGLASQAGADLGKAAPPVQFAGVSEIVMMSATELAQAIQSRSVSCAEVMSAYLDHIGRMNSHVNAIVSLQDRDELMKQARERDEALGRGHLMGWLHGFPQAIKDLASTKGIRTTQGSPILADFVPQEDAGCSKFARRINGLGDQTATVTTALATTPPSASACGAALPALSKLNPRPFS